MNFLNKKLFLPILGISLLISGISINANTKISFANAAPSEIDMPTTLNIKRNTESEIRNYYSSLNSLSSNELKGTNLLKNLKTILQKNTNYLNYDNVWKSACITERDWTRSPANTLTGDYDASNGQVINYRPYKTTNGDNPYLIVMYRNDNGSHNIKIGSTHTGTYNAINREHTWPQSRGFKGDPATGPAGTDLHHLIIADAYVNQKHHNNYPYAEVDSINTSLTTASYVSGNKNGSNTKYSNNCVFEPADEYKGDIARMCFYMVARYNNLANTSGSISTYEPYLTLNNSSYQTAAQYSSDTSPIHLSYLEYLLKWHKEDPVSDFEIYRNDLIYKNFQNNRNPFIDYPSWVDIVFDSSSSSYADPLKDSLHSDEEVVVPPSSSEEPSSSEPSFYEPSSENEPSSSENVNNEPLLVNEAPVIGKEYKLGANRTNDNKIYYATGAIANSYYGATSDNFIDGAIAKVESANGGYYLRLNDSYLNIVVSGNYKNIKFQDTPSTIWTYNATNNTLVTNINNASYFIGCSSSYSTLSCYALSSISSYYPARFYTLVSNDNTSSESSENNSSETPIIPDTPSGIETFTMAKGSKYSLINEEYSSYSSSNTNVASISAYGEISALSEGYSDITLGNNAQKIRVYVKESIHEENSVKTLQNYNVAFQDIDEGSYAISTAKYFVNGGAIKSNGFNKFELSSYMLSNDELNNLRFDFTSVNNGYSLKQVNNGYISTSGSTNFQFSDSSYITFVPTAISGNNYGLKLVSGTRALAYREGTTNLFKYYSSSNTSSEYDFTMYLKRFEYAIDELVSLLTKLDCKAMLSNENISRLNYLYNLLTTTEKSNMTNYEVVAKDGKRYTLAYIYEYVLASNNSSEINANLFKKQIDYIPIVIILIIALGGTIIYFDIKKRKLNKK